MATTLPNDYIATPVKSEINFFPDITGSFLGIYFSQIHHSKK